MIMDPNKWFALRQQTPEKIALARQVLEEVRNGRKVVDALRRYPLPRGGYLGKNNLVAAYKELVESGDLSADPELLRRIRMKPVRTLSGVTTVTVLTKPYPCPGKCIFCPTDVHMPKSYLPDEPGAKRALDHDFDPFRQVQARLTALDEIGHPIDKIELLVLGGTWNSYRRDYQEWFIQRCFDALNGVQSTTLREAQEINETCSHRNVGLVIETRPDHVNVDELTWLRYLGITKVQLGVQSLDDSILALNQRGHTVTDTIQAVSLLRAFGYKIVLHWMPNLLGATPQSDREDFLRLWEYCQPDEIKIYPNQLLANTELHAYWLRGEYQPYTTEMLIDLIAEIKTSIPRYCRVNRIIRDIPSTYVIEGNKRTSLRQDVHREMQKRGKRCQCIRCREVRGKAIDLKKLSIEEFHYFAGSFEEHFLSFVTSADKLAGFLRLSLPQKGSLDTGIEELKDAALIREVHVYGQSLMIGMEQEGSAQHIGLGTDLIQRAEAIAYEHGYRRMAVISAIGTRRYYLSRGYIRGKNYLLKSLGI